MTPEQAELIRALSEIISLIAEDPDTMSPDYIANRYLWDLANKNYTNEVYKGDSQDE